MKGMRSWAEIDLAKLERNLKLIRESIPEDFKYISVVKADAYGHGILTHCIKADAKWCRSFCCS